MSGIGDLRAEVESELISTPGGPWEVRHEEVLGQQVPVFVERLRSLRQLLVERSTKHGERTHLVGDDRRLTFTEHAARVAAATTWLVDHGVGPGDRVAVVSTNRLEVVTAFWAVTALGAVHVACNDRWTDDELAYALDHCDPALVLADAGLRARATRLTNRRVEPLEGLLDLDPAGHDLPSTPIAEDDPALILYTSGTTGRPKGALVSHRGLIGFVQVNNANVAIGTGMASRFGVEVAPHERRVLLTAPLFHVSGLMAGAIAGLADGDTLVVRTGRFDPEDVLRTIERERITTWAPLGAMGPRVLEAIDAAPGAVDVSSVNQLGFGGAPLSPTLRRRLLDAFPNAARAGMGYGSSESVAVVTTIGGPEFDEHPTSAGRVLPTMALEIRDAAGRPVPDGVDGEIHVRSAYSLLGYWRDPGATDAALRPGRWLAMGDVGRMEDGLLHIDSRARDMILRSGENVYPIEIEHRLTAHPAVAEAAVVGVDHDVLGQEVAAVVVPADSATVDTDELAAWCREALASYKVPSRWAVHGEPLPRNAAGKVLKNELGALLD